MYTYNRYKAFSPDPPYVCERCNYETRIIVNLYLRNIHDESICEGCFYTYYCWSDDSTCEAIIRHNVKSARKA